MKAKVGVLWRSEVGLIENESTDTQINKFDHLLYSIVPKYSHQTTDK